MDRRKYNKGTKGNKGGRPPKSDELKLIEKLSPLNDIAFEKLKDGLENGEFRYVQMYFRYMYGKPKQQNNISINTEMPLFEIKI